MRLTSRDYRITRALPSLLMHFVVVLLLLMAETRRSDAFDYSTIKCEQGEHTMVLYPQDYPGPNCHQYFTDILKPSEKDDILHLHNVYRNIIGSGRFPPFPSAEDMMELSWDEELEKIAQRWADQCTYDYDACRDVERFKVGQNISWQLYDDETGGGSFFYSSASRVHKWFRQIAHYTHFTVTEDTSAFSQIVWGSTYRIGCARSTYAFNNYKRQLLVCNYGPDVQARKPLYTTGTPCSKCTCSDRYPALCKASS